MKILMVYPEYPVTFWSFDYILKFVSKQAAYPPLGLLTAAAMLPQDWDIRLIDLNIEKLEAEDIQWADYVMISAMVIQEKSVKAVLEKCRGHGARVIAGGPLFNSFTEKYLPLIDHLVLNEAESTLPPFLADLEAGNPGKVYRSDTFPPLELTPVPRWDLLKVKKYASLMIQCSRGCPFDCEFCDITLLNGRIPRLKSADQFIGEIETLYEMGWRGYVFIVDDNFIGNRAKIKEILHRLIQWMRAHRYPFMFYTQVPVNLAGDDELLELMVEAGFNMVFIGLETPDEESLQECDKRPNRGRDLVADIRKIHAAGIHVMGGYIVGFDNDDEGIFNRQTRFIQESGVVAAMVGLLTAVPNTRLWKRLEAENRLQVNSSGDNTDGTINFIPKMDREKLIAGYREMVRTLYSPRHYYQRLERFLEDFRPRGKRRIQRREIKTLLKSVFYIGVIGNGSPRRYFWKMLFKVVTCRRKSFADAVTLMIYGHHFIEVARRL